MSNKRSRHAFGSEERVAEALTNGTLDAYDVVFMDNGKIGWIDKTGNLVIAKGEAAESFQVADTLPTEDQKQNKLYISGNEIFIWDGTQYVPVVTSNGPEIVEF